MKTGLIMEGGAMRGLFTAGVTDVLLENDISFDGAVGVSAGAAFGCNYKSKQIGRACRYNIKYCRDKRYCSIQSLLKTGDIYGADFCYHQLPEKLDPFDTETYNNEPMEFYVVCTDVISGKPVYKRLDKAGSEAYEWMRASASMPLASRIVELEGKKLLDGGISDSIPLEFFECMGYARNLVILTQPEGYRKEKNKLLPAMKLSLHKYPKLIETMAERHIIYNRELDLVKSRELSGSALVIRPKGKLPVSRTEKDPEKLKLCYELGREAAEERLREIEDFLKAAGE